MTNFSWKIQQLDCAPQQDSLTNVVITAHWRCTGTNDEFNGTVYSTCSFQQPGDQFTPYDQLTEEQVLNWCWSSGVDKVATEQSIEAQIQQQINPPVVHPPLPWV